MGKRWGALNGAQNRCQIAWNRLQEWNYEGHQCFSLAEAAKKTCHVQTELREEAVIVVSIRRAISERKEALIRQFNVGHGRGWSPTTGRASVLADREGPVRNVMRRHVRPNKIVATQGEKPELGGTTSTPGGARHRVLRTGPWDSYCSASPAPSWHSQYCIKIRPWPLHVGGARTAL